MTTIRFAVLALFVATVGILPINTSAQEPASSPKFQVASIFGDHMVLQRDQKVPVWGWAKPGSQIAVKLGEKSATVKADGKGKWMAKIGPFQAGPPLELMISDGKEEMRFTDVLIGEVWLASGQSNMQWTVKDSANADQEIAAANHPEIRLFDVPRQISRKPEPDFVNKGKWQICSPETIPSFSAVAYFFGRDLQKKLNVPVGLIAPSWGATAAESWTSEQQLKSLPFMKEPLKNLNATPSDEELTKKFEQDMTAWQREFVAKDPGFIDGKPAWAELETTATDWKPLEVPGKWDKKGLAGYDGSVWLRRIIEVPEGVAGKSAKLSLGAIDDSDISYVNGVEVGRLPFFFQKRNYNIPAQLLKPGKNVIAVRVADDTGDGGFAGEPEEVFLAIEGQETTMPLAGEWQYKQGAEMKNMRRRPGNPVSPFRPAVLFNAMIHPAIPFAIRGAIWYQGESNAKAAYDYRTLFPAMIKDWRQRWGNDFTFLYVQLAAWKEPRPQPAEDEWAELREAQLMTLKFAKTGMASAVDLGDQKDIHPRNKQDVARRLALCARAVAYGEDVEYMGPIYEEGSLKVKDGRAILRFKHAGKNLVTSGSTELKGFAMAGEDRVFKWASGEVKDNEVHVWTDKVPQPVAVRYGWAIYPEGNLYNSEGLPASPFRTDDWPGLTDPRRKKPEKAQ